MKNLLLFVILFVPYISMASTGETFSFSWRCDSDDPTFPTKELIVEYRKEPHYLGKLYVTPYTSGYPGGTEIARDFKDVADNDQEFDFDEKKGGFFKFRASKSILNYDAKAAYIFMRSAGEAGELYEKRYTCHPELLP